MKRFFYFSIPFGLYLLYGLYLSQYDTWVVERKLNFPRHSRFYDYKGVAHVHTDEGIGRDPHSDIISAAVRAGLDFIIFNDVNDLKPSPRAEGYFNETLSIEGATYSYLDAKMLYIPFAGLQEFPTLSQMQIFVTDLLSQPAPSLDNEGFLVLAHPRKPGLEWKGEIPTGLSGLEVLNLRSLWRDAWTNTKVRFFWSVIVYPFNGRLALLRLFEEPRREWELFDATSERLKVSAHMGSHATAQTRGLDGESFRFPSYDLSFSIASHHLLLESELTGDPKKDRSKILTALASGRFYLALDMLGETEGFAFYGRKGSDLVQMGDRVSFKKNNPVELKIDLPSRPKVRFEMILYKNGKRVEVFKETNATYRVREPGVYRATVRVIPTLPLPDGRRWITWIYTNPIYVGEGS